MNFTVISWNIITERDKRSGLRAWICVFISELCSKKKSMPYESLRYARKKERNLNAEIKVLSVDIKSIENMYFSYEYRKVARKKKFSASICRQCFYVCFCCCWVHYTLNNSFSKLTNRCFTTVQHSLSKTGFSLLHTDCTFIYVCSYTHFFFAWYVYAQRRGPEKQSHGADVKLYCEKYCYFQSYI